jgi:cation diffusion facilitator CzcD-associated flavoprotein CzcO
MSNPSETAHLDGSSTASQPVLDYDAVVIGAGLTGMHLLHNLRQMGLSVRVFDAAAGVGGTWYWNRYPGARFDSTSYTYCYAFSEELLQEWDWSEHFAGQPEVERYLNFAADRLDLRRDIQLNTRVESASFDDATNTWAVVTDAGDVVRSKYLVTAVGVLSAPYLPTIEGLDSFRGEWHHTGLWPEEPVELAGRRVAVIGTGATGIQVIQTIGPEVAHLTVFQRSANYTAPLRNGDIDEPTMERIRNSYPEIFKECRETFSGHLGQPDPTPALTVPAEDRWRTYEKLWHLRGFKKWQTSYRDITADPAANADYSSFVRSKIRERINDPAMAAKLVPTEHLMGSKRIPLEINYYEVFNQSNVDLVDVKATPIERITETGIRTVDGVERQFDVIIFATGFDGYTGAFNRIDVHGTEGLPLKEKWLDGPTTYLGVGVAGFPNMFMCVAPHNKGGRCNVPRCSEQNVEWVTDCLRQLESQQATRIEATPEAEKKWTEWVIESGMKSLVAMEDSWFMGTNIPGKKRTVYAYYGPFPEYRKICDDVAGNGYEGFSIR